MFLEGMNSGYGVKEAVAYLQAQASRRPIVLAVSNKPGNPTDGVLIYLRNRPNIEILHVPWWPMHERLILQGEMPDHAHKYQKEPIGLKRLRTDAPIFFVYPYINYPVDLFIKNNPEFRKALSFAKPDARQVLEIYRAEAPAHP